MGLAVDLVGIVVIAGVVALIEWVSVFFGFSPWPAQRTATADLRTLDGRFERGEIDAGQYAYWRALLRDDESRAGGGIRPATQGEPAAGDTSPIAGSVARSGGS